MRPGVADDLKVLQDGAGCGCSMYRANAGEPQAGASSYLRQAKLASAQSGRCSLGAGPYNGPDLAGHLREALPKAGLSGGAGLLAQALPLIKIRV